MRTRPRTNLRTLSPGCQRGDVYRPVQLWVRSRTEARIYGFHRLSVCRRPALSLGTRLTLFVGWRVPLLCSAGFDEQEKALCP
jgi:hypothetical protein